MPTDITVYQGIFVAEIMYIKYAHRHHCIPRYICGRDFMYIISATTISWYTVMSVGILYVHNLCHNYILVYSNGCGHTLCT
jgi:hypothetical protein